VIEESDPSKVRTVEDGIVDRCEDGVGFGVGDARVDAEMSRQGRGEVRKGEDGLVGAELAEKEVECHCLVRDGGLKGWSDKGLDLDSKWAMADADRGIR
jgi:hypothetical protein